MRAIVLHPNDLVAHLVEVSPVGFDPGTAKYWDLIDSPIDWRSLGPDWGMYFDDEFRRKNLPLNLMATVLYRQRYRAQVSNHIAGEVVVVGMNEYGVSMNIPQRALDYMATDLGWTISQEV